MILGFHLSFYNEIFAIPGFFKAPVLSFGFQDTAREILFGGVYCDSLEAICNASNVACTSLDLFDPRAKLRYDMNCPVPPSEHDRYGTVVDIGSMEHVFDTRQCAENLMRMLRVGGHWLIHTPVNGYYAHGFHTFHPGAMLGMLTLNGFNIVYQKYSKADGTPVQDPAGQGDVLMWLVAVKQKEFLNFTCPQQGDWQKHYSDRLAISE